MAFFSVRRWIRMGRIPAARPKRNKGLRKARLISELNPEFLPPGQVTDQSPIQPDGGVKEGIVNEV